MYGRRGVIPYREATMTDNTDRTERRVSPVSRWDPPGASWSPTTHTPDLGFEVPSSERDSGRRSGRARGSYCELSRVSLKIFFYVHVYTTYVIYRYVYLFFPLSTSDRSGQYLERRH